jgi:hypothetical protein
MIKRLLLVLLIISGAASCGHKIHSGVVTGHWYEPERDYTYIMFTHVGKTTIPIIYHVHDDEDFVIKVKGTYKGRDRSETFYLNKADWLELMPGSCFNDSIPCWRDDPNNTETRQ